MSEDGPAAAEAAPQGQATTVVSTAQPELKFVSDGAPNEVPQKQAPPAIEAPTVVPDPPMVPEVQTAPLPEQKTEAPPKEPEKKKERPKDRYAELVERALRKERLVYLKRLGINSDIMSDEHILALSPDVDVETPDGKMAIDEWRAKGENEKLFVKRESSEMDIDAIVTDFKPSKHGTFGKDLMIKTLQRLAGK